MCEWTEMQGDVWPPKETPRMVFPGGHGGRVLFSEGDRGTEWSQMKESRVYRQSHLETRFY